MKQRLHSFLSAPLEIKLALLLCVAVAIVDIGSLVVAPDFYAMLKPIGGWTLGSMFLFAAVGVGLAANRRRQGRTMVWCIFAIHAASLTWRAPRTPPNLDNPYLEVSPHWPWAAFVLPAIVLLLLHLPRANRHLQKPAA